MKRAIVVFLAGVGLASSVCAAVELTVGDPAPSLSDAIWVKGKPVSRFETGKIYVVEFWATWCGPCKQNIPRLTGLAKKYAGQATISGVSIWESTDGKDANTLSRVSAFVKSEGDKMAYNVAADDRASDIANTWMKAAGESGIPSTFVVGKDGKIAWIGHADGLDDVLSKVIGGKFNVGAAKEQRAISLEAIRPVENAMKAKEYGQALSLMSAILAKRPNMDRYYQYDRYTAYAHVDLDKAKEMSAQVLKDSNGEIGAYQMMCSVYATEDDLCPAAYEFGMSLVQQALPNKERDYLFLSMASAISGHLHDHTKALEYAKQSVTAAEVNPHAPAPFIEFLKRNVQTLEAGK